MAETQTQARKISLDVVTIESPCQVPWNEMAGDHEVRFCRQCSHNVYDISALTREAAEALINEHEGRLCVRYFVRADSTIITADCTPKRAPRFPRIRRWSSLALTALGLTTLAALVAGVKAENVELKGDIAPANEFIGGATPPVETPPATKPAEPPTTAPSTKPADPPTTTKPDVFVGKVATKEIQAEQRQGMLKAAK